MDRENVHDKACKISEQIVKVMLREEGKAADLKEWIQNNVVAKEVTDRLTDPELLAKEVKDFIRQEKVEELQKLLEHIRQRRNRRRMIRFSGIAAAMLLFVGMTLLFVNSHSDISGVNVEEENVPRLILGNGQNLNLKSMTGEWMVGDGINIKNDRQGGIEYITVNDSDFLGDAEEQNTLVVPRQCTYRVILSDGTIVHVNAESRLEYPVKFMGDDRKVKLEGEAFFEVTKGEKPFVVYANGVQIKVYGTKFDVNAYHDDQIETVLIEGKVGVSWEDQEKVLQPSQLSRVNALTGEQMVMNVEVDKYISWIQGYLRYDNDDLGKMVEDLSRWYGVDFEFRTEDIKTMRVTASINKDLPLTNVLAMIQSTVKVIFIKQERGYLISQPF